MPIIDCEDSKPNAKPYEWIENMRITSIRACQPIAQNSPPDWRTSMGQILIVIETDEGLTGYGVGGGGAAGIHVINAVLKPLLIGQSVESVEEHWTSMAHATLPFGRKGLAIMAMSGVDLALWDLRAKAQGVPLARLLNPAVDLAKPIPTYMTVWDRVPEEARFSVQGIKLHLGSHPDEPTDVSARLERSVERVADARERLGSERPLMIDAWMTWDVEFTLAFADRVAELDVRWIEEPIPVDDVPGYEELNRHCRIPIAGGEHEFTAAGFQELIDRKLHTVLQPDVCWVGGLTELVKIANFARAKGLWVVPHRGAELWGLHAVAALCENPLAESGRPWMQWVGGQPDIIDGVISVPERPGFGASFSDDTLNLAGQSSAGVSS